MSDIVFHCPHCAQEIEVSEKLAARPMMCPACGREISAPMAGALYWNFDCPVCGQNLEIEATDAGNEIECPKCASRLRAPSAGHPVETLACGAAPDEKSATARIEVPPSDGLPPPKSRVVTIKRPNGRRVGGGGPRPFSPGPTDGGPAAG
jgi:DNA-directed RNA polymerase subunit RPC12/RpoP